MPCRQNSSVNNVFYIRCCHSFVTLASLGTRVFASVSNGWRKYTYIFIPSYLILDPFLPPRTAVHIIYYLSCVEPPYIKILGLEQYNQLVSAATAAMYGIYALGMVVVVTF